MRYALARGDAINLDVADEKHARGVEAVDDLQVRTAADGNREG